MSRKDYFVKVTKTHADKVKGEKHGNLVLGFTEDVNGDPYTSIDAIREAPSAFEGVKIEFIHKDNVVIPVPEFDENGDPIPPKKSFIREEGLEEETNETSTIANEVEKTQEVKLSLWQRIIKTIKNTFKNIFKWVKN